jgi:hypothetical protein
MTDMGDYDNGDQMNQDHENGDHNGGGGGDHMSGRDDDR